MALEELKNNKINSDDFSKKVGKYSFLVNKELMEQYNGFTVDFNDGWLSKGFRIIPGVATKGC